MSRMGEVRTRNLVVLAIIALLLGMSGCLDGGTGDLVFVEQDPGVLATEGDQQQTPLTSSSKVDLTEPNVQQVKLCVLPFRNLTQRDNLDFLRDMFNQSIQYNLEDYVRAIESIVYDEGRYTDLISDMGRRGMQQPDIEIAQKIRDETAAEVILFGNITFVENQVRIEPYVISFEEGFLIRPMDARPVTVNNFLAIVDSYVQELLDEIIQRRQG